MVRYSMTLQSLDPKLINVIAIFLTVPEILLQCTKFVEDHGLVDGIYRLSGIASNIKRLK